MMEYTLVLFSSVLFHSVISSVDTTDFSACTNKSLENNIPVVSFCKQSMEHNANIVLDGYYANSNSDMMTCTCVATAQAGRILTFNPANFITTSMQSPCESEIKVSSKSRAFIMSCRSQGSINFGNNGEITIELTKLKTTADTRYCILVKLDGTSSSFSITCVGNSTTPTTVQTTSTKTSVTTPVDVSSTKPVQTTSERTSLSSGSGGTPLQTTTSISASSSTVSGGKEDNAMLFIGIGVGCGAGLVIIVVVVIIVIICKRRSKSKTEENRQSNQVADHDELPYNVLYVSADSNIHDDKHRDSTKEVPNNATYDIDGNYSTVDLEDRPEMKKTSIEPGKPVIAPKPKNKGQGDNNQTVAGKESIKHVTAPCDGGVEYAVVDKQGRVSSVEQGNVVQSKTDNTYAVVDKERKRKSSEINTNKIKDQMSRSTEFSSDECLNETRTSTKEKTSASEQHSQFSKDINEGQQAFKTESSNYTEIDLPE